MINRGLFKHGDLLPSEIDLALSLNIGRQTIRQAMSKLVEDGLVERFSGRGTFVCKEKVEKDFFLDRSFSQEMTELGKKTHSKVLSISNAVIDESSPTCFQKKLGAPCLHLTRLRFGDKIPIGLQEAIILTEHCPGLEKHDFTKESLFRVITEIYGLEISEIYHIVNAVIASEEQAELLEINSGDPSCLRNQLLCFPMENQLRLRPVISGRINMNTVSVSNIWAAKEFRFNNHVPQGWNNWNIIFGQNQIVFCNYLNLYNILDLTYTKGKIL